ncbi:MAG: SDR family NAD(P)-dependent oxidoreductase [Spirochaetia bacterium]
MITIDFTGKNVLITGGTSGIGKATALYFARAGAQTWLTYKWGSADFDAVRDEFASSGAVAPHFVQADVSVDDDTDALLAHIASHAKAIDVFVSNVGFSAAAPDIQSYRKRSFFRTLEYSSWPLIEYTRKIHERFGSYPEYIVGVSSDGPDHFYPGYDFVAASKALLELFGRYLSMHLLEEQSRVNIVRFGTVPTDSFNSIFGEDFFEYAKREEGLTDNLILTPDTCGSTIFALCSGLMNAVNGQIIHADYGLPLRDNTMMRYMRSRDRPRERPDNADTSKSDTSK